MPHCEKKMISFFLTTKCNLCCRYCYNVNERKMMKESTLSIEIAKHGIDWYFENNESRHIRFYGPGEPTQAFEEMAAITEYAKQHANRGRDVTVEIQTNGVFDNVVRQWILENVNIAWLSFDGMREIQDYNRPLNPTYAEYFGNRTSVEVLEDNVRWFVENRNSRNIMVGARVTIGNNNLEKQKEMVDYFFALGIRYVWTDPIFQPVGKKPISEGRETGNDPYSIDLNQYIDNYMQAYHYAKNKGLFWGSFLAVNFDGESEYHCRSCTPLSAPHITTDGYISACDMVLYGEKPYHMSPFVVGKWDGKSKSFLLDNQKIEQLNQRKSTKMVHCINCEAKLHCGGYCLGEIVNNTGRLDGQDIGKCIAIRRLYSELGKCDRYIYLHP
jgi:radical SAM protein with 4Fe4S-binding SPASM domain